MANRKIRVILSVELELTPAEERLALPSTPEGANPRLMQAVESAIGDGRYTLAGDAVITTRSVKRFNQTYGTTYPLHSIESVSPRRTADENT